MVRNAPSITAGVSAIAIIQRIGQAMAVMHRGNRLVTVIIR